MLNWHDLDQNRWAWSKEAIVRLRAELRGIDEAIEHTDLAHVMVIGDSQVGKTSLLLRLLGVTDPVAAEQAAAPLRGGRNRGESATAVPIRYQWSGDQDSWSLVHGAERQTEWLSSVALEAKLASFRTGEGDHLQWIQPTAHWRLACLSGWPAHHPGGTCVYSTCQVCMRQMTRSGRWSGRWSPPTRRL